MRVAIYTRVSMALKQTPENQLLETRRMAIYKGYEVEGEYVDETTSKDTRPKKELILYKIRHGELDGVVFWSLDRWGRTLSELALEIDEFADTKIQWISVKESIDLQTPAGRLMARMLGAFANFERDMIHERTMAGLARARAQGKTLGRPRKSPPEKPIQIHEGNPTSPKTSV
jgi:putative DNA-invertase from lambdoid prophage Rac